MKININKSWGKSFLKKPRNMKWAVPRWKREIEHVEIKRISLISKFCRKPIVFSFDTNEKTSDVYVELEMTLVLQRKAAELKASNVFHSPPSLLWFTSFCMN